MTATRYESTDKPRDRRIDALSADQSAMLEQIRDEWIAVGLQTGPADRPAAEAGVRAAYRRAGLEPPGQMLWLDSPIAFGSAPNAAVDVWTDVSAYVRGEFPISITRGRTDDNGDMMHPPPGWLVWEAISRG